MGCTIKAMDILKRLSSWLYKISTGWVALAGLILFLLFIGLVMPTQAAGAELINGEIGSPDLSFCYTPGKLYEMAEAYGRYGRVAYIQARFSFDLIWPLVYTLFLSTAISWLLNHVTISESRWHWANLVPPLGMAFDYAENISTSLVMYRYPRSTNILAAIAPIFTTIKWILVAGSFVLLFAGIISLIWQSFRKRQGD
jgi:hypothetical protein